MSRAERVQPSELAERKKRPWPLMTLLVAGPEGGGLDSDEFEAALQIVDAFKAFTRQLGFPSKLVEDRVFAGAYVDVMSDHDARLALLWFAWSARLPKGLPPRLVRWVEDDEPIASVVVLRRACRLWLKEKREQARRTPDVDKPMSDVLTLPVALAKRRSFVNVAIDARAVNLPVQAILPLPALPAPSPRLLATVPQACPVTGPFPRGHNAVTPAAPPTPRTRR